MRNILKYKFFITITCILTSMVVIPASLYAIENQETLEHEIGVYYTIQKGDTLWDISKKYFNSPWVWPELWKENKYIKNPHFIEPGGMLRLFYNKESDLIIDEEQKPEESKTAQQSEKPFGKDILYFNYPPIDSVGFIKKEAVLPSCSIFKVMDNKVAISEGDLIYIKRENDNSLTPGTKYTVYRTFEPLTDSKSGALIGKQHYITGIVEIKTVEPLYAIAQVLISFREIAINDLLMPYEPRSPKIPIIESNKEIECSIIIPEEEIKLIGDNTIVFINKGEKDGVKPGQFYHIYYREKKNISPDSLVMSYLAPVDFGKLFVLFSEQTTSSALITKSDKEIFTDAIVKSPAK
ncbi:MAG: LysM peptidoglycan-binding domain-containing protein [Desulfobacterium sp.]|nr:LysM peptidoglycan-binding domain-containing protein [Desulfobacterium sp.]MBU3948238.1 LysM peptidoglycan-binding domain-containing protein [Pseudomonadota bacterium]MBU4037806.1 LysM peptidoglycan-binding domain-containing protein [Pseudomonadota bacterium]